MGRVRILVYLALVPFGGWAWPLEAIECLARGDEQCNRCRVTGTTRDSNLKPHRSPGTVTEPQSKHCGAVNMQQGQRSAAWGPGAHTMHVWAYY